MNINQLGQLDRSPNELLSALSSLLQRGKASAMQGLGNVGSMVAQTPSNISSIGQTNPMDVLSNMLNMRPSEAMAPIQAATTDPLMSMLFRSPQPEMSSPMPSAVAQAPTQATPQPVASPEVTTQEPQPKAKGEDPQAADLMFLIDSKVESAGLEPQVQKMARAKYAHDLFKMGVDPVQLRLWVEFGSGMGEKQLEHEARMAPALATIAALPTKETPADKIEKLKLESQLDTERQTKIEAAQAEYKLLSEMAKDPNKYNLTQGSRFNPFGSKQLDITKAKKITNEIFGGGGTSSGMSLAAQFAKAYYDRKAKSESTKK